MNLVPWSTQLLTGDVLHPIEHASPMLVDEPSNVLPCSGLLEMEEDHWVDYQGSQNFLDGAVLTLFLSPSMVLDADAAYWANDRFFLVLDAWF